MMLTLSLSVRSHHDAHTSTSYVAVQHTSAMPIQLFERRATRLDSDPTGIENHTESELSSSIRGTYYMMK